MRALLRCCPGWAGLRPGLWCGRSRANGYRRATDVAVVHLLRHMSLRADCAHLPTLVVLVEAVSNAISSNLSVLRRSLTVPWSTLSISTTLRSLEVASSFPV